MHLWEAQRTSSMPATTLVLVLVLALVLAHLGNVLVDAEGPANMLLAPTVDRCHDSRPPLLDQRRGPHGQRGARHLPPSATSGPRRFRGTLGCFYERLREEYMTLGKVRCQRVVLVSYCNSPLVLSQKRPSLYVSTEGSPYVPRRKHFQPPLFP